MHSTILHNAKFEAPADERNSFIGCTEALALRVRQCVQLLLAAFQLPIVFVRANKFYFSQRSSSKSPLLLFSFFIRQLKRLFLDQSALPFRRHF